MSRIKEKQRKKRNEIIEACLPLIGTMSFEEISIADICASAKISIGSFYHYFNRKSDILVGLLGLIDSYLSESVFPFLTSENEGENLHSLALEWAQYVDSHGIERSRLITSVPPSDVDLNGNERISSTEIRKIIQRGIAKHQFTDKIDAHRLTDLYLLTMRGVTVDWSRRNAAFNIRDCMNDEISIFINGILAGTGCT